LANSTQTIPKFAEKHLRIDRGEVLGAPETFNPEDPATGLPKFNRFKVTDSGISPRALPGTPGRIHFLTGDEHTEYGFITEEPAIRIAMMDKRERKLQTAAREIPQDLQFKLYGPEEADVTIVGWGSTKGIIIDALDELKNQGVTANYLHIRLMSPFPVEKVTEILNRAKKTMIIESNFSNQLAKVIKMETGITIPHHVAKYTGRPISQCEAVEAVQEVLSNNTRKVMLSRGH
jgi:2-oxoglutarate ferredoxin oxidoreductase subunit alpha